MDINIRVNTEVLKNQSDQVMSDLDRIEKSWQEIGRIIKGSKGYWEGDASEAHVRVYEEMKDDAEKVLKRLKENPVKLQQMAGIYVEAETQNKAVSGQLPNDVF